MYNRNSKYSPISQSSNSINSQRHNFRKLRPQDRLVNRLWLSNHWERFLEDIENRHQQAIENAGQYLNLNNHAYTDVLLFRKEQEMYLNTRRQRITDICHAFVAEATFISTLVDAAMKELRSIVESLENFMRSVKSMNNLLNILDD